MYVICVPPIWRRGYKSNPHPRQHDGVKLVVVGIKASVKGREERGEMPYPAVRCGTLRAGGRAINRRTVLLKFLLNRSCLCGHSCLFSFLSERCPGFVSETNVERAQQDLSRYGVLSKGN